MGFQKKDRKGKAQEDRAVPGRKGLDRHRHVPLGHGEALSVRQPGLQVDIHGRFDAASELV